MTKSRVALSLKEISLKRTLVCSGVSPIFGNRKQVRMPWMLRPFSMIIILHRIWLISLEMLYLWKVISILNSKVVSSSKTMAGSRRVGLHYISKEFTHKEVSSRSCGMILFQYKMSTLSKTSVVTKPLPSMSYMLMKPRSLFKIVLSQLIPALFLNLNQSFSCLSTDT